jgi:hypothetical protein
VLVERRARRSLLTHPHQLSDEDVVHPFLAFTAAVVARWAGRHCFHAGAIVANGAAWGVLGDQGAGKSSTLAWLHAHGWDILADDVLVIEGTRAFAGPRSLDLRADAAAALGMGENIGVLGARERWRVTTRDVAPEMPIGGFVFLEWGDEVTLETVEPQQRLGRLLAHLTIHLPPPDAVGLLDLAARPFWVLRRPRGLEHLPEVAGTLALHLRPER